ncbi:MAG TPA: hypothetical protein VII25_09690, partial [Candidatus Acidoferrum sp.]
GVIHFVDSEGNGELKALGEIVGDGHALLDSLRLRVANVVLFFFVRLHHPFIGGMRFADVDGQEIRMIFVVVVELLDVANLATKWWSSKTPEYQD